MNYLIVLIAIFFWTTSSVIILKTEVNDEYGFEYPTCLATYHFLLTSIVLEIMGRLHFFQICKTISPYQQWSAAALGVASIVFININLKLNSIGFYQLTKLCYIPMMVLYKLFIKHQTTPRETLVSLAILLVGTGVFTVTDVKFTFFGLIIAIFSVASTSVFQSRQAYMQQEFKINGLQMNHLVAYPEFIMGFAASLLLETGGNNSIYLHDFESIEVWFLLLSGVFAVCSNILGFIIIGKTGPITFQVIAHAKAGLIYILTLIKLPQSSLETDEMRIKRIIGLVISIFGVILYTYFELKTKAKANQSVNLPPEKPEPRLEERPLFTPTK